LEKENISKNPGLRTIMKLLLNTLWGRFGMNTLRSQVKRIDSREEWFKLIADDNFIIHDAIELNEEIFQVNVSQHKSLHMGCDKTNVPLAAFVTSYARLHLFETLHKLGPRVAYYDTDSIIFLSDKEFEKHADYPKLGDNLGDWCDETTGRRCIEFCSCGPKNYSMLFENGESKIVVKGFTLTCVAAELITFDVMKKIILEDNLASKIAVPQLRIRINPHTWDLINNNSEKIYQFVYDKRVLIENFETRPFGFVE
jgi:hypothetical protein